jgi:hypothetical protein
MTLTRASRSSWVLAIAAFVTFLVLSVGFSFTRIPWWDEGLFTDIALNFRNHGHLGSRLLDPHGYLNWPQVHHYTYWQFPLYLVALGTWLHIVPPAIQWIRIFSIVWGCLYIYCWFAMVRCVTRNEALALLVASIVALDYPTLASVTDGRMDMMCAALGQAGLASFICVKDSNWNLAMFLSGCFGAASLFCHPMGAVSNASLAVLVLLDWRQIRWRGLVAALVPYVAGGAACLFYISEAPQIFLAQARAASGYRVGGFAAVIRNIGNDLYVRYLGSYLTRVAGVNRLKVACLIFALVGTVALASSRRLRTQPLGRLLLILAVTSYVGVAAIDNQKLPLYLIYSFPVMSACGAYWVYDQWGREGWGRVASVSLLAASLLTSIGGYSYRIYQNDYVRLYLPAVSAARSDLRPGGLIMGGSELGFALGFNSGLIDDRFVGYFSGKRPDVFVESRYYQRTGKAAEAADRILRSDYHLAFENSAYKVYARNETPTRTNSD